MFVACQELSDVAIEYICIFDSVLCIDMISDCGYDFVVRFSEP